MRKTFTVLTMFALLCPFAISQSVTSSNSAEDEIRNLERQWLNAEAAKDLPALNKLVAPTFIGTAFGLNIMNKDDVVPPDGATKGRMPECTLGKSVVRIYGDTAVLIGDVQPRDSNAGSYRVTTVFQKEPQGWQMIAMHMSRVSTE